MSRFTSRYRSLGVAVTATALMVGVAACEKDNNNAQQQSPHTAAVERDSTNKPETTEVPTSSSPKPTENKKAAPNPTIGHPSSPAKSSNKTSDSCDVEPQAPEILNNIGRIPPNRYGWRLTDKTNYNRCSDLSYALLTQAQQGNGQFGTQLMLFHKGKFLGVGSDTPQQVISFLDESDDSVRVRMKDWEALDASGLPNVAASQFYSDVTFRWVGDHVEPEGRIPNQELGREEKELQGK